MVEKAKIIGFVLATTSIALTGCATSNQQVDRYIKDVPVVTLPASKAGVSDYRTDFRKIFCDIQKSHGNSLLNTTPCEEALHNLQENPELKLDHSITTELDFIKSVHVIVIPGIFGECAIKLVPPLQYARRHIESHGYKTSQADVSGRSGPDFNAQIIYDHVTSEAVKSSDKLIFIGYSKGSVDALQAVVSYPDIAERTLSVVSLAGPISGTPAADKNSKIYEKIGKKLKLKACPNGDGQGVRSLRTDVRARWLHDNTLPENIDYYSLVAFSEKKNISSILRSSYSKLAQEDKRNDSNVIIADAVIPGSKLLGYANADHWAIALPFTENSEFLSKTLVNRNEFPREAMLESILRVIALSTSERSSTIESQQNRQGDFSP